MTGDSAMSPKSPDYEDPAPPPPEFRSVQIRVAGPVGYLALNRPETLNAFDMSMIEDLTAAAAWFDSCETVKVVIIQSTCRAFSSGFHLDQFRALSPAEVARNIDMGRQMIDAVVGMRAITIAAANGHCIGGGPVLLLACDIRYAADDLAWVLPETHLGIPLPWRGVPRLMQELGPALTAELVLLADRIGPDKLEKLRLINGIVPRDSLLTHAEGVAHRLTGLSSFVLQTTKRQIRAAMEDPGRDTAAFEKHVVQVAMGDDESARTRHDTMSAAARKSGP
jgi:enoyl-CoA hydratase/carnithine racemase